MFRPNGISLLSLFVLSACVTSGDLASGRPSREAYNSDPTEVKTLERPPLHSAEPVSSHDEDSHEASAPASDALRRENAVLAGQVEEARFRMTQLESENTKLKEDLEKARVALIPVPSPPAENPSAPTSITPSKEPSGAPLLWELARKDIAAKRFKGAQTSLEEILKTYPKDARVPQVTLALGMIHYNLEDYKEAALAFNKLIDGSPKSDEAAMAWFGQGACFYRLNQKDDSKLFYEEVVRRFPKSPAAVQAKKWLAKKKGGAPGNLFAAFPDWAGKL